MSLEIAALPAAAERLFQPARVADLLKDATVEELGCYFQQARELGSRAWMAMAVCVGLAQEKSTWGDDTLGQLSTLFGLHRSRIARLGRIYRELLRDRIQREGEAATFLLPEMSWYEVAVETSPQVSRSPDDLLAEAEDRKMEDPRYSIRRWKDDLGLEREDGSLESEIRAAIKHLMEIASAPDDVISALKQRSDIRPTTESARDVLERLLGA